MNFIVGAVVTGAVMLIFRGPGDRRYEPFDAWGAATLLVGYPLLLVGFTFGENFGWKSLPVLIAFGGALLALSGFVWIELHTSDPLIDVSIFKRKLLAGCRPITNFGYCRLLAGRAKLASI